MNYPKYIFVCWLCSKEYVVSELEGYNPSKPHLIQCECGGTIVSNSGKVFIKIKT